MSWVIMRDTDEVLAYRKSSGYFWTDEMDRPQVLSLDTQEAAQIALDLAKIRGYFFGHDNVKIVQLISHTRTIT